MRIFQKYLPIFAVFAIIGVFFLHTKIKEKSPEAYLSLRGAGADLTQELLRSITEIALKKGTPFAVNVVAAAVEKNEITSDDCHLLLHLVGHGAYQRYGNDFDAIFKANQGRICLGGYLHGVEADIAATSPNFREDLWRFCVLMKEKNVANGPCFHGVGHSVFEITKSVPESLGRCDALQGGPEPQLWDCYRGVFSELGNVLLGYDTNTGLPFIPPTIEGVSKEEPYQLCDSLPEKYQVSCYSQLAKVFYSSDISQSIERCLVQVRAVAREVCVNTIFGVSTRVILETKGLDAIVAMIEKVPEAYQPHAIAGAWEGVYSHIEDGAGFSWQELCNKLSKDIDSCLAIDKAGGPVHAG